MTKHFCRGQWIDTATRVDAWSREWQREHPPPPTGPARSRLRDGWKEAGYDVSVVAASRQERLSGIIASGHVKAYAVRESPLESMAGLLASHAAART